MASTLSPRLASTAKPPGTRICPAAVAARAPHHGSWEETRGLSDRVPSERWSGPPPALQSSHSQKTCKANADRCIARVDSTTACHTMRPDGRTSDGQLLPTESRDGCVAGAKHRQARRVWTPTTVPSTHEFSARCSRDGPPTGRGRAGGTEPVGAPTTHAAAVKRP